MFLDCLSILIIPIQFQQVKSKFIRACVSLRQTVCLKLLRPPFSLSSLKANNDVVEISGSVGFPVNSLDIP